MELESLVLFAVTFIFSLLSLLDLKHAIDEKKLPAIGTVSGLISTGLWFVFGFLWGASGAADMYVVLSYLWTVFGFVFLVVTLACVGFILKYAVGNKETASSLEIREERREESRD